MIDMTRVKPVAWKRYKNLFFEKQKLSVLRTLQYEMLREVQLGKKILDFGGGDKAKYHHLISYEKYDSINIEPAMKPTWVTKVREEFKSPENNYDTVLSLNVFEHVYDVHFVLSEIYKALRDGGQLIFSTPFLYPIHSDPDDYFRPTESWIRQALLDANFIDIKITSLVWGRFSTALTCFSPLPNRMLLHFVLVLDIIYLYARKILKGKSFNESLESRALGYFVECSVDKKIRRDD